MTRVAQPDSPRGNNGLCTETASLGCSAEEGKGVDGNFVLPPKSAKKNTGTGL